MGLFRRTTAHLSHTKRAGTAVAVTVGAVALTAACSQSGYQNIDTTIDTGGLLFEDSYIAAAESGDPVAQRVLGNMYYWGEDYERDDQKAAQWWRRAAQNGDERAATHLANLAAGQPVKGELNPGVAREYWPTLEEAWDKAAADADAWWDDTFTLDGAKTE